jgi:hypothetical protein
MRLTELHGYRAFQNDTLGGLLGTWIKNGKVTYDSGGFAFVVIPRDADYAYKVWNHDEPFEQYLEYVKAHSGNKFLMKTIGRVKTLPLVTKRPETFDTMLKILKIEKLQNLQRGPSEYYAFVKALTYLLRTLKIDKLEDTDVQEIIDTIGNKYAIGKKFMDPEFVKTAIAVIKNAGKSRNDFHTDNVMLRDGKTLVITDPYCVVGGPNDVIITASDVLHGIFGRHDISNMKSGRNRSPHST